MEDENVSTKCIGSDDSVRNVSFTALDVHEPHNDTHVYNYRVAKVSDPKNETPVNICTSNMIGCVRSLKILQVFRLRFYWMFDQKISFTKRRSAKDTL